MATYAGAKGRGARASARGYSGVTKLRRTLRRLEPETTAELKGLVETTGAMLAGAVAANAPRDSGDMAKHVGYKVSRDGLTVYAGVGAGNLHIQKNGFGAVKTKLTKAGNETKATIRNKAARWALYKALWHEFGTKGAKASRIGKGKRKGAATAAGRPQPASHFHQRAYDAVMPAMKGRIRGAVQKAIGVAVSG